MKETHEAYYKQYPKTFERISMLSDAHIERALERFENNEVIHNVDQFLRYMDGDNGLGLTPDG